MEQINTLFENLLNIGMGVGAAVAAFFRDVGRLPLYVRRRQPHQMERGKSAIVNALVGFSIVLLARVIAGMIQDPIGSP